MVASRFHGADILKRLAPKQIAVELADRRRIVFLELGEELHLVPGEPADPAATVSGPAEALLRMIYGRGRPEDDITTADGRGPGVPGAGSGHGSGHSPGIRRARSPPPERKFGRRKLAIGGYTGMIVFALVSALGLALLSGTARLVVIMKG